MKLSLFAILMCGFAASSQAGVSLEKRQMPPFGTGPQGSGGLNDLLNSILELVRGLIPGANPIIDAVVNQGALQAAKGIVQAGGLVGLKPCTPDSLIELVLYDVLMLYNNQLHQDLKLSPLGLCKPEEIIHPTAADRIRITGKPPSPFSLCEKPNLIAAVTSGVVRRGVEVETTVSATGTLGKGGSGLVNALAKGVVPLVQGLVSGVVNPVVLKGLVNPGFPLVFGLLRLGGINPCAPNTLPSLLLFDISMFHNTRLHEDLGLEKLPDLCKPTEIKIPTPEDRLRMTGVKVDPKWGCTNVLGFSMGGGAPPPGFSGLGAAVEGAVEAVVAVDGAVASNTLEVDATIGVEVRPAGEGHHHGEHKDGKHHGEGHKEGEHKEGEHHHGEHKEGEHHGEGHKEGEHQHGGHKD